MKNSYLIIKGDKVVGQQYSLKRAKKLCDDIELKTHTNCTVAKEVKR